MMRSLLPLIVMIVGLPQLSETVYTPSLPDIGRTLAASEASVEFTLTIYLFGFATGTLFWGQLSDKVGRKPCLQWGILLYIFGCIGCYFSANIEQLMISRLLQAFGGSTGSVVGQAICREAFQGVARSKAYSTIGSAIAFSPAFRPVMGGFIDQEFGWRLIFIFLITLAIPVLLTIYLKLPETRLPRSNTISIKKLAIQLMKDPKVLACGIIVAACNGILFSFYGEGSFYLIELLELNPATYGTCFIGIALAGVLGGWLSRKLHDHIGTIHILKWGVWTLLLGASLFVMLTLILGILFNVPKLVFILITLGCMMIIMGGISMILPNVLSIALEKYQHVIGAASSLFGLFYYMLISLLTFGMAVFHNDTLFPMPIYFGIIGIIIWAAFLRLVTAEKVY